MTDPLEKTVDDTEDELITTKSKYDNNKQNMVILLMKRKRYNEMEKVQ